MRLCGADRGIPPMLHARAEEVGLKTLTAVMRLFGRVDQVELTHGSRAAGSFPSGAKATSRPFPTSTSRGSA